MPILPLGLAEYAHSTDRLAEYAHSTARLAEYTHSTARAGRVCPLFLHFKQIYLDSAIVVLPKGVYQLAHFLLQNNKYWRV